jgi:hypothetical protein
MDVVVDCDCFLAGDCGIVAVLLLVVVVIIKSLCGLIPFMFVTGGVGVVLG